MVYFFSLRGVSPVLPTGWSPLTADDRGDSGVRAIWSISRVFLGVNGNEFCSSKALIIWLKKNYVMIVRVSSCFL